MTYFPPPHPAPWTTATPAEVGLDPIELRRRNLNAAGDVSALGFRFTTCAQRECLEAVVAALRPDLKRPRGRGVGIAGLFGPGGGTIPRSPQIGRAHV